MNVLEIIMFTLREAARTTVLGLIAAVMAWTTVQVTFFNGPAGYHGAAAARQGLETPASVEPFS